MTTGENGAFIVSVQFGNWSFGNHVGSSFDEAPVRALLAPYGSDGAATYRAEGIDILSYGSEETEESRQEDEPCPIGRAAVLTWDGRLDNREDLSRELSLPFPPAAPDAQLVRAAYRRWGLAFLPKLVGDWALSIWDPEERQLVLARDFMGTRSLFYSVTRAGVQWSTVLDPLVVCAGHPFALDREYLAGWFGLFPASHLTPYVGIHSVPPASCVLIREGSRTTKEFWSFAPGKTLNYSNDRDYEEHFREVFEVAVRRRLRSHFPVLAELSGGMDSSSIVCMADRILSDDASLAPRLDTISYYSSEEPNWNELPFISKVEERRGRRGSHIEVTTGDFRFDSEPDNFMVTPGSFYPQSRSGQEFSTVLAANGNRVLLSGIGGDEILGGAPLPAPLLADLLVGGRLDLLLKELVAWALALRKPVLSLLGETLLMFFHEAGAARSAGPPAWLSKSFVDGNWSAVRGYPRRTRLFGPRPSFQENLGTIEFLRRELSCYPLSAKPAYHKTYPYLDRNLLEFLFSVPPSQLLRPHERRSLMRRALAGIVPDELLRRKRKAFVVRGPLVALSSDCARLEAMSRQMISGPLGIVSPGDLAAALREARAGGEFSVTSLLRVFAIERWLGNAAHRRVVKDLQPYGPKNARQSVAVDAPSRTEDFS